MYFFFSIYIFLASILYGQSKSQYFIFIFLAFKFFKISYFNVDVDQLKFYSILFLKKKIRKWRNSYKIKSLLTGGLEIVEVLSKFLNKMRSNTNLRRQRKTIPEIRKTKQDKQNLCGSDPRFKSYIHKSRSPQKIH